VSRAATSCFLAILQFAVFLDIWKPPALGISSNPRLESQEIGKIQLS